jgi:hypothetical protein
MQERRKNTRSGWSTRLLAEKTSFRQITREVRVMKSRRLLLFGYTFSVPDQVVIRAATAVRK